MLYPHMHLLTSTLAVTCVHAGYLSAVTIPAGAHSVVIREDPFSPENYFGRCTAVSQEGTPHHTTKCVALCCVGWSAVQVQQTLVQSPNEASVCAFTQLRAGIAIGSVRSA